MVAHDRGHLSARRLDGMDAAAQAADRKAFVGKTEKRLRRKAAKNEDRLRLENFKLPAQVVRAARHLARLRIAVVGRTAFQHVQNDAVALALDADRFEQNFSKSNGARD